MIEVLVKISSQSGQILKGTHPRTIPARFGLIWFRGFRGKDLNVKVYDIRRMPSDDKSSHGLWPDELKKRSNEHLISIRLTTDNSIIHFFLSGKIVLYIRVRVIVVQECFN